MSIKDYYDVFEIIDKNSSIYSYFIMFFELYVYDKKITFMSYTMMIFCLDVMNERRSILIRVCNDMEDK